MIERLHHAEFANDEDVEEARWLRNYLGKTGFVQLGFAHQGMMMVYEASTEWYDHYQRLLELSETLAAFRSTSPARTKKSEPLRARKSSHAIDTEGLKTVANQVKCRGGGACATRFLNSLTYALGPKVR